MYGTYQDLVEERARIRKETNRIAKQLKAKEKGFRVKFSNGMSDQGRYSMEIRVYDNNAMQSKREMYTQYKNKERWEQQDIFLREILQELNKTTFTYYDVNMTIDQGDAPGRTKETYVDFYTAYPVFPAKNSTPRVV